MPTLNELLASSKLNRQRLILLDDASTAAARRASAKALAPLIKELSDALMSGRNPIDLATDKRIVHLTKLVSRNLARDARLAINDSWDAGRALGLARRPKDAAGRPAPQTDARIPTKIRSKLRADLSRARDELAPSITALLCSGKGTNIDILRQLAALGKSFESRSAAGASTAVNRGFNEARAQAPGRVKVWITHTTERTCATCAALHGTVVERDEEFDETRTFGSKALTVYGDLKLPPRHPHCHCEVIVLDDRPDQTSLRQEAMDKVVDVHNPLGLAKAKTLSAADLRSIPEGQIKAFVKILRQRALKPTLKTLATTLRRK